MAKPRIHPKSYICLCCKNEAVYRVSKSNTFCSAQCQADHRYSVRIKEWLTEGKDWKGMIPNWIRKYLKENTGNFCSVCGIDKHNKLPIVLEVDHVDGNHTNNSVKNLRLICPNCHSQTPTYKNRNRGKGRSTRTKF
jgi:5-methylcytosine-specific restriction endonuclease McrA